MIEKTYFKQDEEEDKADQLSGSIANIQICQDGDNDNYDLCLNKQNLNRASGVDIAENKVYQDEHLISNPRLQNQK